MPDRILYKVGDNYLYGLDRECIAPGCPLRHLYPGHTRRDCLTPCAVDDLDLTDIARRKYLRERRTQFGPGALTKRWLADIHATYTSKYELFLRSQWTHHEHANNRIRRHINSLAAHTQQEDIMTERSIRPANDIQEGDYVYRHTASASRGYTVVSAGSINLVCGLERDGGSLRLGRSLSSISARDFARVLTHDEVRSLQVGDKVIPIRKWRVHSTGLALTLDEYDLECLKIADRSSGALDLSLLFALVELAPSPRDAKIDAARARIEAAEAELAQARAQLGDLS